MDYIAQNFEYTGYFYHIFSSFLVNGDIIAYILKVEIDSFKLLFQVGTHVKYGCSCTLG